MSGSLEVSITLDDVFSVVGNRRVPLAPELAGYLALEIAEGADAAGGDIDPKSVYIAEEGTVALVQPKREVTTGNAEASIRTMLGRLLEASGSQTPALTAASRRKATGNMRSLAEELEAALIPVNRAAGRRALARLAREVKRVTLGVGRNASAPPAARGPAPSQPARAAESARPVSHGQTIPDEHPTARRSVPTELVESSVPSSGAQAKHAEEASAFEKPTVTFDSPAPRPVQKSGADVDSLLATFEVSSKKGDRAMARELKAMVGLDPTPPPPKSRDLREPTPPPGGDEGVEALLAMTETSAPAPEARPATARPAVPRHTAATAPATTQPTTGRAARPSFPETVAGIGPAHDARAKGQAEGRGPAPAVSARPQVGPGPVRISTAGEFARLRRSGTDRALIVLLVLLLLVAGIAVWMLKLPPGFFTGRTPEKVAQEKAAAEAARIKAAAAQQAASCKASVVVTDVPDNAEVLLREGQAPVDVDRMPVGARLEFVATAEGFAPKRTVVPAGATWDPGPDGKPRFEVAVQLDKSSKPKDLWPAGEPGSEVGGQGPPGTVHIVSTPRGAEIWLLAGIGPEARVEQLACNADVDILVAGPTTLRKRMHLGAADFAPDTSAGATGPTLRIAKISAK